MDRIVNKKGSRPVGARRIGHEKSLFLFERFAPHPRPLSHSGERGAEEFLADLCHGLRSVREYAALAPPVATFLRPIRG